MATKADIVAEVIRSRVTEKVLANDDFKHQLSPEVEAENYQKVLAALETAG
jgi:DNA relaxase NicK